MPDSLYTSPYVLDSSSYTDPVIQSNDILSVDIQTLDPALSGIPGSSGASVSSSGASIEAATAAAAEPATPASSKGYLVDKNGFVDIPIAGKIKVAGLTTAEARDTITQIASNYFVNPIVNVRFVNFKVSVIGEVTKPGQYTIQDERVSILNAIALAGDLTIFGERTNVLLVRTLKNKKEFVRFDLNSKNIFSSPYFYLRQGDILYIEPNKSKAATTDAAQIRNMSFIASAFSTIVIVVTYILFR